MILKRILITVFTFLFLGNVLSAQRTWSLEKCIDHVQSNNTTATRYANLEIEKNKFIQEKNEAARQPDLGFGTNLGLNLGRTLDPSTNDFGTASTLYNNFSLEGDYTIFDGNRTKKRIEQSRLKVLASQADADQLSKDLSLQVLQAYLRILMMEEQLTNTKQNLAQTEDWYRQTQNLINAGLQSQADLRSVEIQKARDEQKIIEQQNFVDRSYVALKLILELDPSLSLKVEKPKKMPQPDKNIENLSFTNVYTKALRSQPGVEGGELHLQSLRLDEDIARAANKPFVSLFAGFYTNYSSGIQDFTNPDTSNIEFIPQSFDVNFRGDDINEIGAELTLFEQTNIKYPSISYFKQLGNNLGAGVGVNVYIPILDKKASMLNGEIARINYLQKQEDNIQFKQRLRTEIQNAIADVQNAAENLKAVEKTHQLLEQQITSMQNKLNLGNINAFEFRTILNERESAQIQRVIAKYDFLLKKMVVDFYEGKELSLR